MGNENTNWGQSVTAVVIKENKVLLARHTYGGGKGMLIVPGGYVNSGETPQQALIREYMEETRIEIKPTSIIGIRFNMHDWYIAFKAEYISKMDFYLEALDRQKKKENENPSVGIILCASKDDEVVEYPVATLKCSDGTTFVGDEMVAFNIKNVISSYLLYENENNTYVLII